MNVLCPFSTPNCILISCRPCDHLGPPWGRSNTCRKSVYQHHDRCLTFVKGQELSIFSGHNTNSNRNQRGMNLSIGWIKSFLFLAESNPMKIPTWRYPPFLYKPIWMCKCWSLLVFQQTQLSHSFHSSTSVLGHDGHGDSAWVQGLPQSFTFF